MDIINFVEEKIGTLLQDSAFFLISVKVKPTNNIKVFLDGDQGVDINTCAKVNRSLYKMIEEEAIYPDGDFSLEVSSPGVDEPLKMLRQYVKNIGRTIELTLNEEEKRSVTGIIKEVNEQEITLEIKPSKKKETIIEQIPFDLVEKGVIQIVF
ncbi:MAG TPA: ribosome maturation factor [Edaphocola sp.]|nr:ribosome maturation factor [Edaphocola sp.]